MDSTRSLDLDQVVKDWAVKHYDKTATKQQKRLREKEKRKNQTYIKIAVDWSEVKFRDVTSWPRYGEVGFQDHQDDQRTGAGETASAGVVHKRDSGTISTSAADTAMPKSSILFHAQYTNDTEHEQEYTMKAEKTTKSSCETFLETTFTRGVEMSVKMATPCELFEANAGYKRELSLTKSQGEVLEEEITWGVESLIKVEANHIANAQLVVDERQFSGDFEVKTTCKGPVYVSYYNLKDNNKLITMKSEEIAAIVKGHMTTQAKIGNPLHYVEVTEDDRVIITTKGKSLFRYGIKQEVHVTQEKIKPSPTEQRKLR